MKLHQLAIFSLLLVSVLALADDLHEAPSKRIIAPNNSSSGKFPIFDELEALLSPSVLEKLLGAPRSQYERIFSGIGTNKLSSSPFYAESRWPEVEDRPALILDTYHWLTGNNIYGVSPSPKLDRKEAIAKLRLYFADTKLRTYDGLHHLIANFQAFKNTSPSLSDEEALIEVEEKHFAKKRPPLSDIRSAKRHSLHADEFPNFNTFKVYDSLTKDDLENDLVFPDVRESPNFGKTKSKLNYDLLDIRSNMEIKNGALTRFISSPSRFPGKRCNPFHLDLHIHQQENDSRSGSLKEATKRMVAMPPEYQMGLARHIQGSDITTDGVDRLNTLYQWLTKDAKGPLLSSQTAYKLTLEFAGEWSRPYRSNHALQEGLDLYDKWAVDNSTKAKVHFVRRLLSSKPQSTKFQALDSIHAQISDDYHALMALGYTSTFYAERQETTVDYRNSPKYEKLIADYNRMNALGPGKKKHLEKWRGEVYDKESPNAWWTPMEWPKDVPIPSCYRDVRKAMGKYLSRETHEALRRICTKDVLAKEAEVRKSLFRKLSAVHTMERINYLYTQVGDQLKQNAETVAGINSQLAECGESEIHVASCLIEKPQLIQKIETSMEETRKHIYALWSAAKIRVLKSNVELQDALSSQLEQLTFLKATLEGKTIDPSLFTFWKPEEAIASKKSKFRRASLKGRAQFRYRSTSEDGSPFRLTGNGGADLILHTGSPIQAPQVRFSPLPQIGHLQALNRQYAQSNAEYRTAYPKHLKAIETDFAKGHADLVKHQESLKDHAMRIRMPSVEVPESVLALIDGPELKGNPETIMSRAFERQPLLKNASVLQKRIDDFSPKTTEEADMKEGAQASLLASGIAAVRGEVEKAASYLVVADALMRMATGKEPNFPESTRDAASFTPGLGWAQDFIEASSGRTYYGRQLSESERMWAAIGAFSGGIGSKGKLGANVLEKLATILNKPLRRGVLQKAQELAQPVQEATIHSPSNSGRLHNRPIGSPHLLLDSRGVPVAGTTIADTFRSATYRSGRKTVPERLFRSYDEKTERLGQYWSPVKPTGPSQVTLDLALDPSRKVPNSATKWVEIEVPSGTLTHEGFAAPVHNQSTGVQLLGGGRQVYLDFKVPETWIKDGGTFK